MPIELEHSGGTSDLYNDISQASAQRVITRMEDWGSTLSDLHKDTLLLVAKAMVRSVCVDVPAQIKHKRLATPIAVGGGKTQLFTAVIQELAARDISFSVMVCTASLEEMGRCYEQLIEEESLQGHVACLHSANPKKRKIDNVPVSTESPKDFKVLLVSHQRIESEAYMRQELNVFKGNPRDFVVWDESMNKSQSMFVKLDDLIDAIEPLAFRVKRARGAKKESMSYLFDICKDYYSRIMLALDAEEDRTFTPSIVYTSENRKAIKAALKVIPKASRVVESFFGLIENGFRIHSSGEDGVILGYALVIPNELRSVFIFDASSTVSQLTKLDKRIELMEGIDYRNVKKFSNCSLTHYANLSTSRTVLNSKAKKLKGMMPVLEEVLTVIKKIPADEAILICSAKARNAKGVDHSGFKEALTKQLSSLIPHWKDQVVIVDGVKQPRFNFTHWGRHRATSAFRHCKHIMAVGVLRRRHDDLNATVAGQLEDLGDPRLKSYHFTKWVELHESFASLQQLMGRGTARVINNGEANTSHLYLWDKDRYDEVSEPNGNDLVNLIDQALPEIKIQVIIDEAPHYKAALEIACVLDNFSDDVTEISSQALGKHSPAWMKLDTPTLRKAAKALGIQTAKGWSAVGKNVVKVGCVK